MKELPNLPNGTFVVRPIDWLRCGACMTCGIIGDDVTPGFWDANQCDKCYSELRKTIHSTLNPDAFKGLELEESEVPF